MSYQPVILGTGLAGWSFLTATRERQFAAFSQSGVVERNTEYFRGNIASIGMPSELVADRQLLSVALGAFGLDQDIGNKAFIERVLSEDPSKTGTLPARLADKRYAALSEAFGFGRDSAGRFGAAFADRIVTQFTQRQFESAIGEQVPDIRLAMGLDRDLGDIANRPNTNDGRWFSVMATPPVRRVLETALGVPSAVAGLDIERQLQIFKDRANSRFGTDNIQDLADPQEISKIRTAFLSLASLASGVETSSPAAAALSVLRSGPIARFDFGYL